MTMKVLENGAERFVTAGGVTITRERHDRPYEGAIDTYVDGLNSRRGAVFSSNYEYPGRYTRWDTAIIDPPLVISARGRAMRIEALNSRGEVLLPVIGKALGGLADVTITETSKKLIRLDVAKPGRVFTEEERSRVPSVFTVLRAITALFKTDGRRQSRPLRRLRLRSRLPVRSGRLQARAQAEPARPRAVPARRDPGRRPLFDQGLDRPLRLFRRRVFDGRPAARRNRRAVQDRRPHPAARRPRARRICQSGAQGDGELQARRPVRGGARPDVLRALRDAALRNFAQAEDHQPLALFLLHQSRRRRVPDRRLAGNVRARQWPPCRDLPDLRHHQARRRRHFRQRADPEAAQFEEGRIRADHVLGRRPQRQVAGLRAGLGARHRPPPDRDVFAPDPHRRPYRGAAARRHGRLRRLPVACLGGHRHRRAEIMGHALHRAEREEPARLVWRGDRHGQFQR